MHGGFLCPSSRNIGVHTLIVLTLLFDRDIFDIEQIMKFKINNVLNYRQDRAINLLFLKQLNEWKIVKKKNIQEWLS
jgi:hypothetical protein